MSGSVVVVGAGIGGLAAAIRLQAAGQRVTLVEKRSQFGGRAGQIMDAGYTFDTGPSIITAPHLLHDLWQAAGGRLESDVSLVPLSPFYRIYFQDGRWFDYGGTQEQTEAEIARFEPRDVAGYRQFMDRTGEIYRRAFEDLAGQPFHHLSTFASVLPELLRLNAAQSVYGFASHYFRHPYLRMVFSFHPLFIGGNPLRASSIYAIVPYLERSGGVWFAQGGMYALVQAMARLFERLGGEVRLNSGVDEILVDHGRATGARLTGGQSLTADAVVANSDVANTYLRLVAPQNRPRMTDRKVRSYRYSMSCYLLYLGLDRRYEQLRHHTILMSDRYQQLLRAIFDGRGLPRDVSLYLHAPSRTDPSLAPEGGESLYVLAPVPHLGHGVDWERESGPFRDRLIHVLEHELGLEGLLRAIRVEHRYTPLDFRDDLSSYLGSAFSIEPTLFQSAWFRPHNVSEDVAGLYLVGAGTHPGAGIPGVLLSAKITAALVNERHAPATAGMSGRSPLAAV